MSGGALQIEADRRGPSDLGIRTGDPVHGAAHLVDDTVGGLPIGGHRENPLEVHLSVAGDRRKHGGDSRGRGQRPADGRCRRHISDDDHRASHAGRKVRSEDILTDNREACPGKTGCW